jgi:hypothetical protein
MQRYIMSGTRPFLVHSSGAAMKNPEHEQFSEDEAKTILARAIELDARAPVTTREDIREIATELGVSPAAVDAALREHIAAVAPPSALRARRTATMIAALGLPIGAASGVILTTMPLITSVLVLRGIMGVGLVASGALLVAHSSTATLRSFNARNTVLWSGMITGSLAAIAVLGASGTIDLPWFYTIAGSIQNWLASTVLGSAAVLAIRRSRRGSGRETGQSIPDDPAAARGGRVLRFAKRVIRWFTEKRGNLTLRSSRILPILVTDPPPP